MKRMTRIFSLALCAAALLSLTALAAGTTPETSFGPVDPPKIPAPLQVWGKVSAWGTAGMETGPLLITSTESDALHPEVLLRLPEGVPCVDAATGLPLDMSKVKDGDILYAWIGPAMAMSLPPQATALVVVGNVKPGTAAPQYYEITGVDQTPAITIYPPPPRTEVNLPVAGGEVLKIPVSAQVSPWLTRQIVTLDDLIPGSQVLVWRDKAGAVEKVLLFPYGYAGYLDWGEEGRAAVNGRLLSAAGQVERNPETGEELVYLPLRAVAEAAGYSVAWDKNRGAVVYDQSVETVFSVFPGGTVLEMPGRESTLSGPCILEKGVTYLPAVDLAAALNLYICG